MGSLVSRQLPGLWGGVSQQPATLRSASQCEEMLNAYPTIADGVRKRPPFEHVKRITAGQLSGAAHIHTINRDTDERYIVVVTDGDLQVYDMAGNELTVNFPLGKEYLENAAPVEGFSLVSIADYSFVVNKAVEVKTTEAPPAIPTVIQEGTTITPGGTIARRVQALELEALRRYYTTPHGAFRGTRQTFQDLPNPDDENEDFPPHEGDVWKIAGYDQDSFGAYYVVRRGGVWEETYAPGQNIGLDPETMPWALVRESDGTFTFTHFNWDIRHVGDSKTNPPPTFVNRPIQDVFFYKNRLGLITDENVVFSCAGDYGNFWRNTVTDMIDSDVVDVAVSSTKVSKIKYAVPFANRLMLFADQTQFALNVDDLLTPTSVSIDTVTEYEISTRVRPVGVGSDVYFVTPSGAHSRVREYHVMDGDSNAVEATDVTAHVPRYLPRNIQALAGTSNEDALFLVSGDDPATLYGYKFFWTDEGKMQSAWFRWRLAGEAQQEVLAAAFLDNLLYVLVQRADGVHLERTDIQSGYATGNLANPMLIDRLVEVTPSYNAATDITQLSLPYEVAAGDQGLLRVVRGADFGADQEALLDVASVSVSGASTAVTINGKHDAGPLYVGLKYPMHFEFSEQFVMNQDRAITTGRLQLRTFVLYFQDTAFFQTEVAPYGWQSGGQLESIVPAQLAQFSGKTLGAHSLELGQPVYHTGQYAFQIYGNSREARVRLINDSHVQCRFQSAEWEGLYHNRARSL